jgi:hypothetical protein
VIERIEQIATDLEANPFGHGDILRSGCARRLFLPWQRLAQMKEPARRAVLAQQRQLHARLRAFRNLHRSSIGAQICLHPTRMRRVHFDLRIFQLVRQVYRE